MLIRDLLHASRIDAHRVALDRRPLSLLETASALLAEIKQALGMHSSPRPPAPRQRTSRRRLHSQEHDVTHTARPATCPDGVLFGGESSAIEPLAIAPVGPRRPDRQDPTRPQRAVTGAHTRVAVELVVGHKDERRWAVVDVEEDGVEGARRLRNASGHVPDLEPHPCVIQWPSGEMSDWSPVPGHQPRHQLGHDHPRGGRDLIENSTQRETETEAAYEDRPPSLEPLQRQRRQRLLRSVRAARHEHAPAGPHRPLRTSPREQ